MVRLDVPEGQHADLDCSHARGACTHAWGSRTPTGTREILTMGIPTGAGNPIPPSAGRSALIEASPTTSADDESP